MAITAPIVPGQNPRLDAESLAPTLLAISISLVLASAFVVGLRVYTRVSIIRITGWDDVTIVVAQALSIAVSVLTILQANYGLGRHVWMVPQDRSLLQLKCLLANIVLYNAGQTTLKISFLIQYRRIFSGAKTQAICLILLIFIGAWGFAQEFIAAFACVPLTIINPNMTGKCIKTLAVWYLTSSMNVITDFMIFVVPLPSVLRLQIELKQKVGLVVLFCLGFFTCAISLIRISTLQKAAHTTDPTWDNVPAAYWSVVELNCGILCASLPTLRPLMHKWFPHLISSYGCSGTNNPSTYGSSRRKSAGLATGDTLDVEERVYGIKEMEVERGDGKVVREWDTERKRMDSLEDWRERGSERSEGSSSVGWERRSG